MKYSTLSLCVSLLVASSVYSVDIAENIAWSAKQLGKYTHNLLHDTTTQAVSVGSVVTGIAGYQYYHYHAALVCLDGHHNGRIMHASKLVYMTYSDFIQKLESLHSYGAVLEFVHQYCTVPCGVSDRKINKFIALANDLQVHNKKRLDADVELL